MEILSPIPFKGDFIHGEFVEPGNKSGSFTKFSPANLNEKVMKVDFQESHVDEACSSARRAFEKWSLWSMEDRMEILNKVKDLFVQRQEEFALTISRETGKPLWEAKTEARAMIGKFDVTFKHSLELIKEIRIEKILPNAEGFIRFRPRGVFAVLGPFNFPGHLPGGHIIPALVTGNTVVFKPSELTPATGQLMAECYQEACLPSGVFNLVQGQGETGHKLVTHKKVDGVLFTGSYETGLKIKKSTVNDYWKLLALEMGGKNSTIIWEDADRDKAVYESLIGAYLSSGQRCSCTSRIFVHKNVAGDFIGNFHRKAKSLRIGHWSENPFMGPLINEKSRDSYLYFMKKAMDEGCEKIMEGKALDMKFPGFYVTPSLYKASSFSPDSIYQNTEIFGPNVIVYEISDLDEALETSRLGGYGLSMALFSKDPKNYQYCLERSQVGLINWNRTTNGASSRLPFGGRGKSGNDRPSAHFAVYYCTVPVASLEDHGSFDPDKTLPGMNWDGESG